jgi:hypothetical protein
VGLTIPYLKNSVVMKLPTWAGSLVKRPNILNMDTRFRTWNIRSLYRTGSLVAVSKEQSKCKLDVVGVQEVRWEGGGTELAGD